MWKCVNRNCYSTLFTTFTNILINENNHNLLPDYGKNETRYIMHYIKKRSVETRESPRDIFDCSLLQSSVESYKYLPKYRDIIENIRRNRISSNIIIKNQSYIPEEIKITNGGNPFYLYDSGEEDNERVIIFSTNCNLIHLENSDIWISDGTFKTSPPEYEQISTIMGLIYSKFFPLFYIFMKRRTMIAYSKAFEFLSTNLKKIPDTF
ncbi:hypothetical protein DMUE_1339 [Dictyocoela muelleri]|nr:hypothetical protein DMUE_1339 [Dictyocoela muelleri]